MNRRGYTVAEMVTVLGLVVLLLGALVGYIRSARQTMERQIGEVRGLIGGALEEARQLSN